LIYLYAGLVMAMLLPILVGLQTAVSVAELEQGELAMQEGDGKVIRDFRERQVEMQQVKATLLENAESAFKEKSIEPCPTGSLVNGFIRDADGCSFFSSESIDKYVSRVFNDGGRWSYCIVPDDPSSKCPEEY